MNPTRFEPVETLIPCRFLSLQDKIGRNGFELKILYQSGFLVFLNISRDNWANFEPVGAGFKGYWGIYSQ
jgi:hypothetical protein